MNNTQQKQALSWSDWHDQLFAKLSAKQKEVLNRNTKTVYSFYNSGKLPEDVVAYVCGGVL